MGEAAGKSTNRGNQNFNNQQKLYILHMSIVHLIVLLINNFNFENEQPEKNAPLIQLEVQVSHRKDKFAFIWQKYENGKTGK